MAESGRKLGRGRSRRAGWWLVLGLLTAWSGEAEGTTIERIRSASGDDFTRVVVDVDGSARYRYGLVPGDAASRRPARLYLDLEGVRLEPGKRLAEEIRDRRVAAVRAAQHQRDTARIVFDLSRPVKTNVFSLSSPPRIVIDLTDSGEVQVEEAVSDTRRVQQPSAARAPPRSSETAQSVRRPRIVIDPGHGGRDPGAKGYRGIQEKDVVLELSKRVAKKLADRLGVEVHLTRTTDTYVALHDRTELANRLDADLFVSIHANAGRNSSANGIETYYLQNTDDRATLRLASLENGIGGLIKGQDVSTDADLPYILSDMVQGQKEADSIVLANHIQRELVAYLRPRYQSVKNLGVKQGPFLVLDGTYMASVLVETGFLTNATEAKRVTSPTYREAMAEGIYRGIRRYLEDSKVPGLQ